MPVERVHWEVTDHLLHELAPRQHKYVVLIPVLNEGARIRRQMEKMKGLAGCVDLAIIDGGSRDGSVELEVLRQTGVRALAVKTGPGRLSAQLRIGLAWAMDEGYAGAILIDGNDKDDSSAVPLFIAALEEGYDHLQGSRFIRGGAEVNTPLSRHLAVKFIHAPTISLAARFRYTDTTNGFRAYSRRFLLHESVQPFRNVFNAYELHYYLAIRAARLRFRVKEIPVTRSYPLGDIPTKIKGWRGNMAILRTLLAACLGRFDPPEKPCAP